MPTTYLRRTTNSDLTVLLQAFSKVLSTGAAGGSATQDISAPPGAVLGHGFTEPGVPSTGGGSGTHTWTVELDVPASHSQVAISVRVNRVGQNGFVQSQSAFSAEQTNVTGTTTFTLTGVNLGTWTSGDRLRVDYRFRSTHAVQSRTVTVRHGGTENEVIAPWDTVGPPQTIPVGIASETETARAVAVATVGPAQPIAVGVASETETARTVALSTTVTISVSGASEAETARPVAVGLGTVSVAVGLASETESSQAITPSSTTAVAVGAVSEDETARTLDLTATTSVTVGGASESEAARTVVVQATGGPQTIAVVRGTETESAQAIAVTFATIATVGGASETETAHSVSVVPGAVSVSVLPSTEAENARTAALSLGGVSIPVGGVPEAETASQAAVTTAVTVAVGGVSETEVGRVVDIVMDLTQTVLVGRATETENARLVTATVQGLFRLRLPSLPAIPSLSWRPSRWPRTVPAARNGRSVKRFNID